MIPDYPEFTNLTLEHKDQIQSYTSGFESYSDFNFTSLYCWDTDNSASISLLNGNLVIRIPNYMTGEPVHSILGETNINQSIKTLLNDVDKLELVPEIVVRNATIGPLLHISEDRDNFDYIYNLDDLVAMPGGQYKQIRNKLSQFKRNYPDHKPAIIEDNIHLELDLYIDLFLEWAKDKNKDAEETEMEKSAITRMVQSTDNLHILGTKLYIQDQFAGFSICEILPDQKRAICHFQKTSANFTYADTMMTRYMSEQLIKLGCRQVNWEQDLGIPGLRQLKESYRPEKLLKKFTIHK